MRAINLFSSAVFLLASLNLSAQENLSIPFLYRNHLYVQATINDTHHCNIIYDTGAANMFGVDSIYLAHSEWTPSRLGYARAGGGAGNTKVRIIVDSTKVNIGNLEDLYKMVPVFKLRDVVDCHVDGIWGIKNIADYPFEINFEHNYLMQHRQGLPSTDGYTKLPIQYENNKIMLEAETYINGTLLKGWYLMDTGGGGSIDFTSKTVQQYQLGAIPGKRYTIDITQFGLGDKEQESLVDMMSDLIVIGNDTIRKMPITYIPEGTGAFSDRPYLGTIGNEIWSRYNIIIDAKNKVLYLRRFKPDSPQEPIFDFSFRNRTDICRGWIVSSMYRDGDAAQAGMALGDTITAINGKNVSQYTWDEEYDVKNQPQQILDITGADGKEKQITLEAKERW